MAEFSNPNQKGGSQDNGSLFILMAVMVVIFFGLQYYKAKHNPQTESPAKQAASSPTQTPAPLPTATAQLGSQIGSLGGQTVTIPAVQGTAESTTTVENELYKITFSNRGAQATEWILKRFKDVDGQPLNLIHAEAAKTVGYPLSLYTYDAGLTASLAQALYVPSATGALTAPANLTFKYAAGGYEVTKTFSFDESYVLHADTLVTKDGAPIRSLLAWPGGFGDQADAMAYAGSQLDTSTYGKEEHVAPKKISGGNTLTGPFDWAGVSDLYFASIFLPDHAETSTVATLETQFSVPKVAPPSRNAVDTRPALIRWFARVFGHSNTTTLDPVKDYVKVPLIGAALGDASGHTKTRIFAGPKAVDVLKNIHAADPKVTLEPLLDFGFFGIIGKYLFLALRAINEHVSKNWGWDIVWLTILINLIILPLRIKTMQSGLKMQRIQPQMDAIKAKYKNLKMTDPKRNDMNAEIMELQKREGVNMFGGCVPTLIQMPLLFAMFGMLPKVVEMRQAHWYWLPDLSAADPYHILPIVMILSQFLVQFYTPSPGVDPQQQKMMAFMMPAFSGYMTWNYSSGLALYWSVGNLISIATQQIMNQTSIGREMREIAAKRARRKGGNGPQTIQGKPGKR
ncbi:protein translocase subunit yidC [Granulicella rosea]|uniref:Membrane protein insertase YidC n=1 Tax=Granulicella rosea TaxID=474952 RepID=A0A239DPW0_9BACT|nr:membrane protein insertase YidC [Granulicella rosea]SNS34540.1 protein translocase subunit yidC [Granulicella rosea]